MNNPVYLLEQLKDRILAAFSHNQEYDEGFYDCSRGTCPQGHSRMVDD
jgi:hypothetical protein